VASKPGAEPRTPDLDWILGLSQATNKEDRLQQPERTIDATLETKAPFRQAELDADRVGSRTPFVLLGQVSESTLRAIPD
jgi:hypothetical protein